MKAGAIKTRCDTAPRRDYSAPAAADKAPIRATCTRCAITRRSCPPGRHWLVHGPPLNGGRNRTSARLQHQHVKLPPVDAPRSCLSPGEEWGTGTGSGEQASSSRAFSCSLRRRSHGQTVDKITRCTRIHQQPKRSRHLARTPAATASTGPADVAEVRAKLRGGDRAKSSIAPCLPTKNCRIGGPFSPHGNRRRADHHPPRNRITSAPPPVIMTQLY